jgi:quinol monooxygenase YgiN
MSAPVLIGFAGVLVAAAATGMLAGRCVRRPRIDLIVWTAAILGLTIALAAQSMGFARGFGPLTFRAIQLFALLLAPLWLAWGLVELVAANEAARFGMRLVSGALTVVASVILATDPLTAEPFSQAWPPPSLHFQPVAFYALGLVQAAAVLAVVVSAGLAAARARSDPPWRPAMAAVVPAGLAVLMTAGLRFPLPAGAAYPLLSMAAAALVWFGASRVRDPSAARRDGGRDGVRDGSGRYRSGGRPDAYRPAGDVPEGEYVTYGQRGVPPGLARPRRTGAGPPAMNRVDQGSPLNSAPPPRMPDRYRDRYRGSGPGGPPADERRPGRPAADAPGALRGEAVPGGAGPDGPDVPGGRESGPQAGAAGPAAAAPARPYGRILVFTLLDDRAAEFDRIAEEAAEEVRKGEPGTLVYVIHLVPNAPMQRIFYEIYRDRAAFDSHESQPYMQRFMAERRSCVLATNVIDLWLKYAKVAPLPSPQAPAAAPARLQPLPPGAWGPHGPPGSPRLQPLPPARPQRLDQQRYDQRWPDQDRPDQPWPDPRQLPSAGRRPAG